MNPAASLIGEIADRFVRERLARWVGKRLIGALVVNGIIAVLGLIALAFLYLALDLLIAERMGKMYAAAILFAGNLVVIAAILIVRAVARTRRRTSVRPNPGNSASDIPEVALALALGRRLESELRRVAPEMTIAAAIIGLVVGANPEILNTFRRRRNRP